MFELRKSKPYLKHNLPLQLLQTLLLLRLKANLILKKGGGSFNFRNFCDGEIKSTIPIKKDLLKTNQNLLETAYS